MAIQFQTNLSISAGTDFSYQFSLKNPDQSPVDVTGYSFHARIGKHRGAVNAITSTSESPIYKYVNLTSTIDDAAGGKYSISLDATTTAKLQEGKYVYAVTLEDTNGNLVDTIDGLVFVKTAFGYGGSLDPNYP